MADRTIRAIITGSSAGAVKAFEESALAADASAKTIGDHFDSISTKAGGAFSRIGATIANFTGLPVMNAFSGIGDKISDADTKGSNFGKTLSTLGGAALLAGAAGFAALADQGLKAADAFETAQSSLQTAVKNSGTSFASVSPAISTTYNAMAKLGFNSTDTATALTTLTTATGSPKAAMKDLSVAADLARMKHLSLGDASSTLAKTLAGSTRALTSLGLNLDIGSGKLSAAHSATVALQGAQQTLSQVQAKVADGSLKGASAHDALANAQRAVSVASENLNRDHQATATILDTIKQKTEGAANAFGNTFAGQMQTLRAQVHNLFTEFGEKLVPVLQKVMEVAEKVFGWLGDHKAVLIAVAAVVGGVLVGAIGAFTVSLFAAGGVLEFLLGPVGIVIAIVAALAAVAYEVVTHWGAVSGFFKKLWGDVEHVFVDAWDHIKAFVLDAWHVILTIFEDTSLVGLLYTHWHQIVTDVSGAVDAVVGFFTALPGRIVTGLGDVVSTIWSGLKGAAQWVDDHVIEPVWNYFVALPQRIFSGMGAIVTTIWAGLVTAANWVDTNVIEPVVNFFVGLPGRILSGLGSIGSTIWSGLVGSVAYVYTHVILPILGFFEGIPGGIQNAFTTLAGIIEQPFKDAVAAIVWLWNHTVGLIPGMAINTSTPPGPQTETVNGQQTTSTPIKVKKAASGGIVQAVPGGRLVNVAEGGQDEAIIPLSRGMGGMGGTVNNYNITQQFTGPVDPNAVIAAMIRWQQSNGNIPIRVA